MLGIGVATAGTALGTTASTASPGCGYRVGGASISGAAGSSFIDATIEPAQRFQTCSATITARLAITDGSGRRPANIQGNGLASTVRVQFFPNQLPPDIAWRWSPHCADPAGQPLSFTVLTDAGGTASGSLGPSEPCRDFGATSSTVDAPRANSPNAASVSGMAATSDGGGYWTVGRSATVENYGDAPPAQGPAGPSIVGIAAKRAGTGYWLVGEDGGVFTFGDAAFHGSLGATHLNAPIVGIAATPDGGGYWLAAADGGIFTFGNAAFHGSLGATHLNAPISGIAATPDGGGYWLVGADGGIFTFGNAAFFGARPVTQ